MNSWSHKNAIKSNDTNSELELISDWLLSKIRTSNHILPLLDEETRKAYHGFEKVRFDPKLIDQCRKEFAFGIETVQAELVTVSVDLSHTIHIHKNAYAICTILGRTEMLEDPVGAKSFLGDCWSPVSVGETIRIPPHTPHTFTVLGEGGILHFLSVQSPDIEQPGHDDFYYVKG